MGRPRRFDEQKIIDVATGLLARNGPARVSITKVAAELGAPSGSIYHRFPSRDALLATAWLRAVRRFQTGYLAALEATDVDAAAVGAAVHVPRWCALDLDSAVLLHCFRLADLVGRVPTPLDDELRAVNDALQAALHRHAALRYGSATRSALRLVTFALLDIPAAAVRRPLEQRRAPGEWVADAVAVAARAVLAQVPAPAGDGGR